MIRAFGWVSRGRCHFVAIRTVSCHTDMPSRPTYDACQFIDLKEIAMHVSTRRRFIEIVPFAGLAFVAACSPKVDPPVAALPTPAEPAMPSPAPAEPMPTSSASMPMVGEKDAQAVALGYVDDAARANTAKYTKHVAGSQCSNCALYLGKTGDAAGMCPLFAGKHVAAKGWCSSWIKKA